MEITSSEKCRIGFGGKHEQFLDINQFYFSNGLVVYFYDFCSFWALLEDETNYKKKAYKVVLFPNKICFNEWFELLEEKPKIVFSSGKVE